MSALSVGAGVTARELRKQAGACESVSRGGRQKRTFEREKENLANNALHFYNCKTSHCTNDISVTIFRPKNVWLTEFRKLGSTLYSD